MRTSNFYLILLLIGPVAVQAQELPPATTQYDAAQSRLSLDQLSQDYGRYDYRQLEPLAMFAQQLMASNQFDEAHIALDKAA